MPSHVLRGMLLSIALGAVHAGPAPGQESRPSDELRLHAGDVVRIEVRDDAGLGGQFQVGEDGGIFIPVIGLVPVTDRPFEAVRRDIAAAYAAELRDPVVRITPLLRVAVLGQVARPGLLPVDPPHTLGDVLATVGGLTPLADPGNVTLVRDGEQHRIGLEPGSPALARSLRSGDRIVVGRRGWFMEHLAIFVGAAASVAAAAVTTLIVR